MTERLVNGPELNNINPNESSQVNIDHKIMVRRLLMVIAVTINTRWWPPRKVESYIGL